MAITEDGKKLLYKLAKSYYIDNLTQAEVGKRFGLSRIKVSRLLQRARDEQIVQITIVPQEETNAELERTIEFRYGLDEAIIFTPSRYEKPTIVQELGPHAADCLLRCLQGNEVLSLSWGTTILSVIEALSMQNWPKMKVVQMLGVLGRPDAETYGADLVGRIAQTFRARPRLLPAPGVVSSKLVRDALYEDVQIADTLALAAQSDIALVGIGRPTPGSVVIQAGTLTNEELVELHSCGAVGDIALRFFDAQGRPIEHEINDRMIGLDLEQIKAIPRVIGVSCGAEKFEVIRGALRGKLIDVLITDDQTAARLLEDSSDL